MASTGLRWIRSSRTAERSTAPIRWIAARFALGDGQSVSAMIRRSFIGVIWSTGVVAR
ncbi:hypothetical protein D3C78_911510 [compost metagenome]